MKFCGSDRGSRTIGISELPGGKDDPAALRPDGSGSRLEKPDYPESPPAIADRNSPRPNALGEAGDYRLERLPRFDRRAPPVAGRVTQPQPPGLLSVPDSPMPRSWLSGASLALSSWKIRCAWTRRSSSAGP